MRQNWGFLKKMLAHPSRFSKPGSLNPQGFRNLKGFVDFNASNPKGFQFPGFINFEKQVTEAVHESSRMKDYTKYYLESEKIYHIFNRGNGNDLIFSTAENYRYFLRQYHKYISPIADTYVYCQMPNHFHFVVQIKAEDKLKSYFEAGKGGVNLQGFQNLEGLVGWNALLSRQFGNFFNAYAKAYNKQHARKGSLFMPRFKRKPVEDIKYLRKLVHYVHWNPVSAGLVSNPSEWEFSSYGSIVTNKADIVMKTEALQLFDTLENFMYCHKTPPALSGIE